MARMLTEFPNLRRGRAEGYPWAEWFDGTIRLLELGTDFDTDPTNFRTTAYVAARRHGIKIRAAVLENGIALEAIGSLD